MFVPDDRVRDRIYHLKDKEIGFHKIRSLKQDGNKVDYKVDGTILEVKLDEPIDPGNKTTFKMNFHSQVPLQIRRSGRDNKEGIRYSMSQWYPKMCEYDDHGWHNDPYVGREFHGVWGDFDVSIKIDSSYVIGGTGILQNPKEIGHGYLENQSELKRPDKEKLTWQFKAKNVHDFMWGADPDYLHKIVENPESNVPELHFFYQDNKEIKDNWDTLQKKTVKIFDYMNKNFGTYPYDKYSVIQGGDGGMEYPMATLITGQRGKRSLIGVTVHEAIHSWFHGVLANNENMYPWMDEGFTSYATSLTFDHVMGKKRDNPHRNSYRGYKR
ncbi:MAG: M1 family metallopeptidase, partial [Flavobacteriales bacterium]